MASADELGAPAAPPGALQRADARGRWLLPLAPPLLVAQTMLVDYNDSLWRNRLSIAAEVAVAGCCLALLAGTLHRHRHWRPALAALPLTVLLTWVAWDRIRHGASMSAPDALLFLASPLVGLGLLATALVRRTPRLVVATAVAWFPVPLALFFL